MRVLLVHPQIPDSYWSGGEVLRWAGCKAASPPLGLITIAALLPAHWDCRLIDLTVQHLRDDDLRWADVVLATGMLVQRESLREVIERCRRLGVRTVVGGPYATATPEQLSMVDHIVVGEAEEVVPVLATDLAEGRAQHLYRATRRPALSLSPVPRYDLLKIHSYHSLAIQFSRGCPYACEFCNIDALYGRRPRTKTVQQIVAELEAIRATGFSGPVFFVDDNFIADRKPLGGLLREMAKWRQRRGRHLEFYTEVSVDLADEPELIALMTRAGFNAVFIGLESPSTESLAETGKLHNLRGNMLQQVRTLWRGGLEVWGGFIVGFDHDGPDIFDRMIHFIQEAAIPRAMVGILGALPKTALYTRLTKERRLRPEQPGDQFCMTNVMTRIPDVEMVRGYRRVLETLYDPESYLQRCLASLSVWQPRRQSGRSMTWRDLVSALRGIWRQGVTGYYRLVYWRYLYAVMARFPSKASRAIAIAMSGHHFVTYTRNVVVPRLSEVESRLRPRDTSAMPPRAAMPRPAPQPVVTSFGRLQPSSAHHD
jgi:radical SAM superfamily enzyme YgiQ (UPF0313 family)